jgi:hypothetical protein
VLIQPFLQRLSFPHPALTVMPAQLRHPNVQKTLSVVRLDIQRTASVKARQSAMAKVGIKPK